MTINGKEVHLYAGMVCVEIFVEKTLAYPSGGTTMSAASIIYGGIVNYCAKKEIEVPVTFEEVYDEVENKNLAGDDFKEAQDFQKTFSESLAFKKKVEDVNKANEEVKKKQLITDSLPTTQESSQVSITE